MRNVLIVILIAVFGVIMFHLGIKSKRYLDKTIVLTLPNNDLAPNEGDLFRVQYVSGKKVYLCIID
jgi:hypothetical protein